MLGSNVAVSLLQFLLTSETKRLVIMSLFLCFNSSVPLWDKTLGSNVAVSLLQFPRPSPWFQPMPRHRSHVPVTFYCWHAAVTKATLLPRSPGPRMVNSSVVPSLSLPLISTARRLVPWHVYWSAATTCRITRVLWRMTPIEGPHWKPTPDYKYNVSDSLLTEI